MTLPRFLLSPLRFLPLEPAQLSLAAVLKCGQTFLWKRLRARATLPEDGDGKGMHTEGLHEWAYGHVDRTIVLRQDAQGIYYRSLFPASQAEAHRFDIESDTTLSFLRRYFVLDVSLPPLYSFWSERDANFAKKTSNGTRYGGIRILRQPAWECLIEFICSSNNNIGRIEGMLRKLSRLYGEILPSPAELDTSDEVAEQDQIFAFPRPEDLLAEGVTAELRTAGFGYRDAYVTKTAALVCSLAAELGPAFLTPQDYLESLSQLSEEQAREALLRFSGVGPKVADCILLFGLGFEDVVPVDTHVYQIAVRDYGLKGSKDATVNKVMYSKVRSKLQEAWGQKAGWAHQILFTADLRSFADFADPLLVIKADNTATPMPTPRKIKDEEESASTFEASFAAKLEEEEQDFKPIIKVEEPLPPKRRRTLVSSYSENNLSKTASSPRVAKRAKREPEEEAYPSPPNTPLVDAKVEEAALELRQTVLSTADRVKKGGRAKKVSKKAQ